MAGMDAMMAAVVPPTDDEFRAFLTQVHDDVEIEDFVQIVGNDLEWEERVGGGVEREGSAGVEGGVAECV